MRAISLKLLHLETANGVNLFSGPGNVLGCRFIEEVGDS